MSVVIGSHTHTHTQAQVLTLVLDEFKVRQHSNLSKAAHLQEEKVKVAQAFLHQLLEPFVLVERALYKGKVRVANSNGSTTGGGERRGGERREQG